jgi:hypothetical protein
MCFEEDVFWTYKCMKCQTVFKSWRPGRNTYEYRVVPDPVQIGDKILKLWKLEIFVLCPGCANNGE